MTDGMMNSRGTKRVNRGHTDSRSDRQRQTEKGKHTMRDRKRQKGGQGENQRNVQTRRDRQRR